MTEAQNDRRIESLIDRRIRFLISEARLKDSVRVRDQTITYAFRVVTNHFSRCHYDIKSSLLREKCPYRSKKAYELSKKDPKGWLDKVTNEHQYPIKDAWNWIIEQSGKLTVQDVKDHLMKWPVVVVTKEENNELHKYDSARGDLPIDPNQRYHIAGIKVLKRNELGKWLPRRLLN